MIPSKRGAHRREGGDKGGREEGGREGGDRPDTGGQTPEVEPERKEDDLEDKESGTGGGNRDELS